MTLTDLWLLLRWLMRDTFRQATASRVSWLMVAVSGLAILICLSIGIEGEPAPRAGVSPDYHEFLPPGEAKKVDPFYLPGEGVNVIEGRMTLLFGAVDVPLARTRLEAVRSVQLVLAGGVADTFGMFLALLWTAGFLPSFLEPASATVLLAKPIPRWCVLAGKFLGVLLFVLVQATLFVCGTWLALALRTNVWDALYLFSIPMLVLHFAIFFSFSTMLAVWTRSAVVCSFGAIVFWLVCWGMNYGHHVFVARQLQATRPHLHPTDLALLAAAPQADRLPAVLPWPALALLQYRQTADTLPPAETVSPVVLKIAYWLMPKPADLSNLLFHALRADNYFSQLAEYEVLRAHGAFHPGLSILSSLLFMLLLLAIAAYEFVHMDY